MTQAGRKQFQAGLMSLIFGFQLGAIALALAESGLDYHTFHNTDRSKSFEARLEGFDPAQQMVTTRRRDGQAIRFQLELLAREDRQYVLDNAANIGTEVAKRPDSGRGEQTVEIFILAGQSNMQGHGIIPSDPARNGGQGSLEYLVENQSERFGHLAERKGWKERDDVWIHYLDRKGALTAGYGARSHQIGPELGFGWVVGEKLEQPVLLIKLAWGGKSLGKDFRPPSAGGEVGTYYRQVVELTKQVLAELEAEFPKLSGRQPRLAGFGWHQGWNDRVNQDFVLEYESNLSHLIRDLRRDLAAPDLPFVIAETGMGGLQEKHPRALGLMEAQAAVANRAEFKGNVAFVATREFQREVGVSPSKQGYHWNSNADTYYLIGEAMGQAMLKLLGLE